MITARLPHWSNCRVFVKDIGRKGTFWGELYDLKENKLISPQAVFDQDEGDWIFEETMVIPASKN